MLKISIIGGNKTTGELDLDGKHDAKAKVGEKIEWEIDDDTVVKSIELIAMKGTGSKDIFSGKNGKHPEKEDNKKWKAKVSDEARIDDVYEYLIKWKDDDGNDQTYDPKISISTSVSYLAWVISFILVFLGLSLIYWRMKKMKSKKSIR